MFRYTCLLLFSVLNFYKFMQRHPSLAFEVWILLILSAAGQDMQSDDPDDDWGTLAFCFLVDIKLDLHCDFKGDQNNFVTEPYTSVCPKKKAPHHSEDLTII